MKTTTSIAQTQAGTTLDQVALVYWDDYKVSKSFARTLVGKATRHFGPDASLPGWKEGLIPVWGSTRHAAYYFHARRWGYATLYAVLGASEAFLIYTMIDGIATGALKAGSHSWSATRAWYQASGRTVAGEHVHHWFFHQSQGLGKFVPEVIKNQPWNLMAISIADHQVAHNGGVVAYLVHGTPQWAKSASLHAVRPVRSAYQKLSRS